MDLLILLGCVAFVVWLDWRMNGSKVPVRVRTVVRQWMKKEGMK